MAHLRLAASVLVLMTVAPLSVVADETPSQESDRTLSERQRELNNQGVEAIEAGEYETAINLYEASLQLGELNIIYANLGRARQLAGDCREADDLFDRALEAPVAEVPPPEVVEDTVERYRDELTEECPGYLSVGCEPTDLEIAVDGRLLEDVCDEDPRGIEPGDYQVVATRGDQQREREISVEPLETSRVEFEFDVEPQYEAEPDVEAPARFGWLGWTGAAGVVVGAGALGGAAYIDGQVASHRRELEANSGQISAETMRGEVDRIDTWQSRGRVLLLSGIGFVVAGSSLIVVDALSGSEESGGRGVGLAPRVDRPGLSVISRW